MLQDPVWLTYEDRAADPLVADGACSLCCDDHTPALTPSTDCFTNMNSRGVLDFATQKAYPGRADQQLVYYGR